MKTFAQVMARTAAPPGAENFDRPSSLPMAAGRPAVLSTRRHAGPFSAGSAWPNGLRLVGILAFVQSLIFLVIWLLVCANAGAATASKDGFDPNLQTSVYNPVKQRDPFSQAGAPAATAAAAATTAPTDFHLEGILYQPVSPSAIVNDKLVTLGKTTTLDVDGGQIQVKAIEITRNRVVLEAGGQKVELLLNPQNPAQSGQ